MVSRALALVQPSVRRGEILWLDSGHEIEEAGELVQIPGPIKAAQQDTSIKKYTRVNTLILDSLNVNSENGSLTFVSKDG